ncbi:MAG TPA: pyridine nucleotide-disulfide oxidoreductase, partial [Clostridiales bacterium]|nr:pyridine nucleotide-disulfide oxidoreductase [Clostridiales bacterium]
MQSEGGAKMSALSYDVVIIGGGPAGMAAALASRKQGAKTLVLERDVRLGGILNQCIHQGFGLHYFGEEMTGPEYADRFRKMVEAEDIDVMLESMVLSLDENKEVCVLSPTQGYCKIKAGAIVLAMGCRERTAGAIALPGTRPAGIYTAGMAQKICNLDGYLVG